MKNAEKFVENIKEKEEGTTSIGAKNFISPIKIKRRNIQDRENQGSNISGGGSDFSSPV